MAMECLEMGPPSQTRPSGGDLTQDIYGPLGAKEIKRMIVRYRINIKGSTARITPEMAGPGRIAVKGKPVHIEINEGTQLELPLVFQQLKDGTHPSQGEYNGAS